MGELADLEVEVMDEFYDCTFGEYDTKVLVDDFK